uniref:Transposase (Putative), gypsy type n=1 Tax=Tanacetum cinerariifolium TaxID=118510 RepID=A0A6L2M3U0_TANCI|nr:hypothetical protein [Tanacetum cinerariifolium]
MGTIDSIKSILTQSALDALYEKYHIPDNVHPELPGPNDRIRNSPTVICYCGRQGLSFRDLVPRPRFCSDRSSVQEADIMTWMKTVIRPSGLMMMRVGVLCLRPLFCSLVTISDLFLLYAEMNLFAFIHHADPTKVRIGEMEVREGEFSLLELTQDRVVLLAGVNDQENANFQGVGDDNVNEGGGNATVADQAEEGDHAIQDERVNIVRAEDGFPAIAAEKPRVQKKRRKADGASGSNHPPKKVRADHDAFGDVGHSTGGKSLAIIQELFEQSTLNVEVDVIAAATRATERSSMPPPSVLTAVVATTITVDATFALVHESGTGSVSRSIFRDSASPSTTEENIAGPSQPAVLEGQVAAFESAAVIKDTELASYHVQIAKMTQDLSNLQLSCDELSIKAASLESEKDKLIDQVSTLEGICSGLRDKVIGYKLFKDQIEAVQDEQVKVLSDKVVGLDADLMGMALHLDEEFYPRYLTTIAGRRRIFSRGLKLVVMKCLQSPEYLAALGGAIGRAIDKGMQDESTADIDHGIAGRGLAEVAAYNPTAEANYVASMNALSAVNFPLPAQLSSHKDASMYDLMDLLRLKGPAAETSEASQLQPSPDQLMLPIHRLEDQVVIGETSLSFFLDLAHARVQRLGGNVASRQLSISDALVPLIEPLSAENLVGEASTSEVPVMTTTTALSTTFIQANTVPSVVVTDHEVSGAGPSTEVPPPFKIMFEKEELETMPEHTTTS